MSHQVSPEQAPALPARPATGQSTQATQPTQPTQTPPQPPQQPQATAQPPAGLPSGQPMPIHQLIGNATTPQPEPQTLREKLDAGDKHWQWKIGFRIVLILLGIIGIGCAAWALAKYGPDKAPYDYELSDAWALPWTLITFGISVIWSSVCILVFWLRRPHAPVHPGAQVGVDLILWLAFIPTAMFATLAVMSVAGMGSDGRMGGPFYFYSSSSGHYSYVESNNTWVWDPRGSSGSSSYTYTRDCAKNSSSRSYYSGPTFSNCTEEDNFVNNLWRDKSYRFNTELTAVVCQYLMLFIHLTLFIWACVDTNRRNSRKVGKDAEVMAAEIVMKMVQAGAIIPAPGAAQMRPMPGQMPPQMMQQGRGPPYMAPQMFPQQQYPQQYQQHYGHFAPEPNSAPQAPQAPQQPAAPSQIGVASSSNEKGAGPRFA